MRTLWCLFLIRLFASAADVSVKPAVQLSFATETRKLYQVQTKRGPDWQDSGLAFRGTGRPISQWHPAGEYRLTTPKARWVKVWADEFNGTDLDYGKWSKEENNYGGGNSERQAYRTDPNYCFVQDGNLNIAVHRDPHTTRDGKTQPYSSARIRTLHRGDWTFGRCEIRAKLPDGQGIWPAIWMLPTDSKYGGWAAGVKSTSSNPVAAPSMKPRAPCISAAHGLAIPTSNSCTNSLPGAPPTPFTSTPSDGMPTRSIGPSTDTFGKRGRRTNGSPKLPKTIRPRPLTSPSTSSSMWPSTADSSRKPSSGPNTYTHPLPPDPAGRLRSRLPMGFLSLPLVTPSPNPLVSTQHDRSTLQETGRTAHRILHRSQEG